MAFAQLVVGPPGSGKSTYCNGMYQMMSGLERCVAARAVRERTERGGAATSCKGRVRALSACRKVAVVNLDPANDSLSYPCAINVEELVCLEEVMREHELGPNGGLVFCMEYIEANLDWLLEQLEKHPSTSRTALLCLVARVVALVSCPTAILPSSHSLMEIISSPCTHSLACV